MEGSSEKMERDAGVGSETEATVVIDLKKVDQRKKKKKIVGEDDAESHSLEALELHIEREEGGERDVVRESIESKEEILEAVVEVRRGTVGKYSTSVYRLRSRRRRGALEFAKLVSSKEWRGCSVIGANDILTATPLGEKDRELIVHTFLPRTSGQKRIRKDISIRFKTNELQKRWLKEICRVGRLSDGTGIDENRTLLVAINPFGGKKKAKRIFEKYVQPIFRLQPRLKYEVLITQRAGHAREVASQLDVQKYFGMIAISGDGLLFEIVNGIMHRKDAAQVVKKIQVGIIAGGSGNGLATSVHALDPTTAAYCIAKGWSRPLDLFASSFPDTEEVYYGFLLVEWAIISDIDFESEVLRFMGGARFTVRAIGLVAERRLYRGRLHYLPASVQLEDVSLPSADVPSSAADAPGEGSLAAKPSVLRALPEDHPASALPEKYQIAYRKGQWLTIEDNFTYFVACNAKAASYDAIVAPRAQIHDGWIDLVFCGDIDRVDLANVLLDMEEGHHVKHSVVQYHKVYAFILEPLPPIQCLVGVDGERAPPGPCVSWIMPSTLQFLGGELHLP